MDSKVVHLTMRNIGKIYQLLAMWFILYWTQRCTFLYIYEIAHTIKTWLDLTTFKLVFKFTSTTIIAFFSFKSISLTHTHTHSSSFVNTPIVNLCLDSSDGFSGDGRERLHGLWTYVPSFSLAACYWPRQLDYLTLFGPASCGRN